MSTGTRAVAVVCTGNGNDSSVACGGGDSSVVVGGEGLSRSARSSSLL